MVPSGVVWGTQDFEPEVWHAIERAADDEGLDGVEFVAGLRRMLAAQAQAVVTSLTQKLARSRVVSAVRRNLVEASTMVVNDEDGITVFPLRCHTVIRASGQLRTAILEESRFGDPTAPMPEESKTYTLIKYPYENRRTGERGPGEVWRQNADQDEAHRVDDEDWRQYIIVVPEIPDVENYPYGYAYHYMRLIAQMNHAEASLGEAMAAAAYWRIVLRQGSSTADKWKLFAKGKSGQPWVGNAEDITAFVTGVKIGDWGFVAQVLQNWKADLAKAFALGIKDRPSRTGTSATEILEIVDEISTQIEDLHTAYEDTLQKPLFASELALFDKTPEGIDLAASIPESVRDAIRVVVTTGTSVLSKQQSIMRFALQLLPAIAKLDQRVAVEGGPILEAFEGSLPFETGRMWRWNQQQAPPEMPDDALTEGEDGATLPRTETIMTPGGPQPPQPQQGVPVPA